MSMAADARPTAGRPKCPLWPVCHDDGDRFAREDRMTIEEVLGSDPVLPQPDDLTAFFWEGAREGRLLIQRCGGCGHYIHPPKPICPACHSFDLQPAEVVG